MACCCCPDCLMDVFVRCFKDEHEYEAYCTSQAINRDLKKDKLLQPVKILLLGAGESGKSTFVKQMKILHKDPFTKAELAMYRRDLLNNVIDNIRMLIEAMDTLNIEYEKDVHKHGHAPEILSYQHEESSDSISEAIALIIMDLWNDSGIKTCYERRNELQVSIVDSAKYYLDNVKRITAESFTPTEKDILMSRRQTTGIIQNEFHDKDPKNAGTRPKAFMLIDVGGQRGERRKWIKAFSDVTAIIFLAAISEYDQILAEDGKTNRLLEARNLFQKILQTEVLQKTKFILFLNKADIFKEKMKKGHIKKFITKYPGNVTNVDEATKYIEKDIFIKAFTDVRGEHDKGLYSFVTVAIDPKNTETVFKSLQAIIFSGIMGDINLS